MKKFFTNQFKKMALLIGMSACVSITASYAQEPIVTVQNIPYVVNFGSAHFTTYPNGLAVSRGISNSFKTNIADVTTFPAADFTDTRNISATQLTAPLTNSVGGSNISGGSNAHSYLDGSDAKLLITLSTRLWGAFFAVKTSNNEKIKVSYSLQLTERAENNTTAGLDLTAYLQYRTSTTTGWSTVAGSQWNTAGLTVGGVTNYSLTLPGIVDNLAALDLRIVNTQTAGVGATDLLSYAIDNISVTGTQIAVNTVTAVAFKIKSVTPTSTSVITAGKAFSVVVESADPDGAPFAVTSATGFSLAVVGGSGTLNGTVSGIILASTSSAIVSGISYSQAGVIVLSATATSGQPLTSVTSVITVTGDPLSGLNVLFSENFEDANSLPAADNFPVSVSGFTAYNLDNETLSPSGSPGYGSAGFVVVRTIRGPWRGNGLDNIGTETYFDNTGSTVADSNFVAGATSFFVSSVAGANRWLVLPAVTLSGENIKLAWQSMSRGSFNFRDSYRLKVSATAPSDPFITADFELISTVAGVAEFANEPSRRVTSHSIDLPATLKGLVVYIAFEVFTPAPGGDRIFFDNILVTSTDAITGVDDVIDSKSLAIYPNPATATLFVASEGQLTVSSTAGNTVIATTIVGKTAIDVSGLALGLYVVKLQTATGVQFAKFIKE